MLHSQQIEPLDLAHLGAPVDDQFRSAIEDIVQMFADESEKFGTGNRTAEITVKLTFEHNLEHRQTALDVTLTAKLPKFRTVKHQLRLPRGGTRFLVEIDDDQPDLFHPDTTTDTKKGN